MKWTERRTMWIKGLFCALVGLCFVLLPLRVQADETKSVTIYGMDSKEGEKIRIPDHLPQSYQIMADGGEKVSYRIVSGDSAKVSSDGLVTPKYSYWRQDHNASIPVQEGEPYDYFELNDGDTEIAVETADRTFHVTVRVEDYAIKYGDDIMDAYLREEVAEGMDDWELLNAVARFPASYDYSGYYSSAYSMIIYGGGSCFASTDAIIILCKKLGIKAWARNGSQDSGAGGGHVNAMVELNGKYYVLDAGFSGEKGEDGYRSYDVKVKDSLFSYKFVSGSMVVYQYDGYEDTGVLVVPETISGRTVDKIDTKAFSGKTFSEIKLPDSLQEIGDNAFYGCSELTRIEIPASVTKIGKCIFTNCDKLTDLSVAAGNTSYKAESQVIYSKDGRTLVACPTAAEVTIPKTVEKIGDYAFYSNTNLKQIRFPSSVKELGEEAFGVCINLAQVTFEGEGLTAIGAYCFESDFRLSVLRLPASVNAVGLGAFNYCRSLKYLYFKGDAPSFGGSVNGEYRDEVFSGSTVNAFYAKGNSTWTEEALGDHGGSVTWSTWEVKDGISLEGADLALGQSSYVYTGKEIIPELTLTVDGTVLTDGKDYIVEYSQNVNAGAAEIWIWGIGIYEGQIQSSFTIAKADRSIGAYADDEEIVERGTTWIRTLLWGNYEYKSEDPSTVSVDDKGFVSGIAAGTTNILVHLEETENYLAVDEYVRITVTHGSEKVVVDPTVVNGCVKVRCKLCDQILEATVPTDYRIMWSTDDYYYYYDCGSGYQIGDILYCKCQDMSKADLGEMEVISLDERIVQVRDNWVLHFVGNGVAKVEVRPKYNPAIGKVFTISVGGTAQGDGNGSGNGHPGNDNWGNGSWGNGDWENDNTGNTNPGNSDSGGSNPGDSGQTDDQKTTYHDKKTGITVSINNKKEATLTAVDKKKVQGTVTIPNTMKVDGKSCKITAIGKNAFKNQKKLKKVVIGKYVKTIGDNAFSGCDKLQTVSGGKSITAIGNKAFYKCKKLQKITIPAKVKKIGKSAFYGCKSLKTITIQTKMLTNKNVGSKAFKGVFAKPTVKVPKGKLSAYKKLLKAKGMSSRLKIK